MSHVPPIRHTADLPRVCWHDMGAPFCIRCYGRLPPIFRCVVAGIYAGPTGGRPE